MVHHLFCFEMLRVDCYACASMAPEMKLETSLFNLCLSVFHPWFSLLFFGVDSDSFFRVYEQLRLWLFYDTYGFVGYYEKHDTIYKNARCGQ